MLFSSKLKLWAARIQASLQYIKSMKGRKKILFFTTAKSACEITLKSFRSGIVTKRKWAWDQLSGKTGDWERVEFQAVSEGSRDSVHSSVRQIYLLITFEGRLCCAASWLWHSGFSSIPCGLQSTQAQQLWCVGLDAPWNMGS